MAGAGRRNCWLRHFQAGMVARNRRVRYTTYRGVAPQILPVWQERWRIAMTLGERLQALRKSRGLSQEQLAEQAGVSRQAVSK